ncbi:hypothetical protein [Alienimonas californiensis]|uniref:hypothetical protein n=1 Tax=Alienimonas californiensis TaxID=2527989 RepID=UPI0011A1B86E|nr:hypothetical protein [Alienimonas californiensis]
MRDAICSRSVTTGRSAQRFHTLFSNSKLMQRVFLAALAVVLAPVAASAAVTIDTFSAPPQTVITSDGGSPQQNTVVTGVLGGERDLRITGTRGEGRVNQFGNDALNFVQVSGGTALLRSVYDGIDGDAATINTSGLGGFDLTQGGANDSFLLSDVTYSGVALRLIVRVFEQGALSTVFTDFSTVLPAASDFVGPVFIPFGTAGAGVLSNVGAIELRISDDSDTPRTGGQNLTIGTFAAVATVPEPMSLTLAGLLGVGLCGGAYRRRKQGVAA